MRAKRRLLHEGIVRYLRIVGIFDGGQIRILARHSEFGSHLDQVSEGKLNSPQAGQFIGGCPETEVSSPAVDS